MATKIQDKISSKNIKETHNMSYYGTATVGFGDVYITQDVVTDVNLSAPTAACEACGEEAAFCYKCNSYKNNRREFNASYLLR